jgi:hypothetical protein
MLNRFIEPAGGEIVGDACFADGDGVMLEADEWESVSEGEL